MRGNLARACSLRTDIAALRREADIVVASCHWGLGEEVLDYMTEIAHAAIDAGADIVIGHGPHYSLPVEIYRGKPIFYGLGSFSFHTGHGGRRHGVDEVGFQGGLVLEFSAEHAIERSGRRCVEIQYFQCGLRPGRAPRLSLTSSRSKKGA